MSDPIQWIDTQVENFFVADHRLLYALILFVILDYITGVFVAIYTKRLSSQIGAKGITKKIAVFVVIAFCHVLDAYLMNTGSTLESVATVFYSTNECISILKNIGKLGVPLPKSWRRCLII